MSYYIAPVARLIEQFERLPGIGHKNAQRLAFHVLRMDESEAEAFAQAILDARKNVTYCRICQNISQTEVCRLCADESRDKKTICVVEQPKDVAAIERTHRYRGSYHVLHGVISPIDNVGPGDIRARELLLRLGEDDISEVIMATNPTVEGDATAMYLSRLIKQLGVKVTRIAYGIPVGGDLEYADDVTLMRALEGRREL
ncbi:MAG: recombination protein RecR [Clostridia bacterium]|nr:recombination protein RecR [Clostridia bacterium]MBQ1436196.1 recombination protein RecR [Clostridia bacterium]